MASKTPAKKRAPSKKAAPKAQASPKASDAAIEIGPMPLVAHQEITITATKLPPDTMARISISPEGTRSGVNELKSDPLGQIQTAIIPVAGPHKVIVEWHGGKAVRDFDVAAE